MKRRRGFAGLSHSSPDRIRLKREHYREEYPERTDFPSNKYSNRLSPQPCKTKHWMTEEELWNAVLEQAKKVHILASTPYSEFDNSSNVDYLPNLHYKDRWTQLYDPKVASQPERTTTARKAYPKRTLVGSGTYGSVYWTESPSKRIVALKRINVPQETLTGLPIAAVREWMILQRLNHKNIVSLLDIIPGEEEERDLMADDDKIYYQVFLDVAWEFQRKDPSWALKLVLDQQLDSLTHTEDEKTSFYRNCREIFRQEGILKDFDDKVLDGISKSCKKVRLKTRVFWMVFEYLDHDLSGLLDNKDIYLKTSEIKYIIHEVLRGLKFCHDSGVMHRDIKGSNILVNNSGEVKLCDFGLSCVMKENEEPGYSNRVVSLFYRAPELLLGSTQYSVEVDIWSAGCVFAQMMLKGYLFQGRSVLHQFHKICEKLGVPSEDNWSGCSRLPWYAKMVEGLPKEIKRNLKEAYQSRIKPEPLNLLDSILILNPSNRPSIPKILSNPYFHNPPAMSLPRISHAHTSLTKSDPNRVDPHLPSPGNSSPRWQSSANNLTSPSSNLHT